MKPLVTLLIVLLCALPLRAQSPLSALLPYPNHITVGEGELRLRATESLAISSEELRFAADALKSLFHERMDLSLEEGTKARIRLSIDPTLPHREGYRLTVDRKGLSIEGGSAAGVFYGIQTLDQLLTGDSHRTARRCIAAVNIDDAPLCSTRALMLDPARHFLPIGDIKRYIDEMARYKYNRLQLHLTDDQGWRIEIKSHPELTARGAFRTDIPRHAERPQYYTQEQLRDLVAYAAQRHVEIVPEIDVPGHTAALLTVYPQFRCAFLRDSVFVEGKTFNIMLSAAVPEVYTLMDDVLREIAQLFPSRTVHLGGDESAIAHNWARSDEHLALMRQEGYTCPEQLMGYFFDRVLSSARRHGLHSVLWCELDNIYPPATDYLFPYPDDVTLVAWRGGLTPTCIELTRKYGNPLLLAPGEHCYFDYPQYENDLPEFQNWGMPLTTLEQAYAFDPTYGLPHGQYAHLTGMMGTLWGEAIRDINRAFYMTYPRGLALAEAGWTQPPHRDWTSFVGRMYPNLNEMMRRDVSFRVPTEVSGKAA